MRTLVLTSMALYRIAFSSERGAIDHYSRTSLGSCKLVERGRYAFKLHLTEPDGRENPFTYFWSAYVKKGAKDNRYERVYYPIHPEGVPVELVLACVIYSLQVANRIMCEQVGQHCYVTRLEVRDYQPNASAVDDFVDAATMTAGGFRGFPKKAGGSDMYAQYDLGEDVYGLPYDLSLIHI